MRPRCLWAAVPWVAAAMVTMFIAAAPQQAVAQAACNLDSTGNITPGVGPIGTINTVDVTLLATNIRVGGVSGQTLVIERTSAELDCTAATLGFGCTSDGSAVTYADDQIVDSDCTTLVGGAGDTVRLSTRLADGGNGHQAGDATPNHVHFVPVVETPGVDGDEDGICETGETCDVVEIQLLGETSLGAGDGESCSFSFDVEVTDISGDSTPFFIEAGGGVDVGDANCPGNGLTADDFGSIAHELEFNCDVELDKQVSCDGGATWFDAQFDFDGVGIPDDPNGDLTLSTACIGWNESDAGPAEPIMVRWLARNTGDVDLNCTDPLDSIEQGLGDTNGLLLASLVPVDIPVDSGLPVEIATASPLCSDDLAAGEPNTATLNCFCEVAGEVIDVASDTDSAQFDCETPGLALVKDCETQDANGENAIDISWDLPLGADATLVDCELTDIVYEEECGPDGPTSGVIAENVIFPALSVGPPPDSISTAATTLTADSCNEATITCSIEGAPVQACVDDCALTFPPGPDRDACIEDCPLKTISASDFDTCEVREGDCYTRTPGRWGTHPADQEAVYDAFGPVLSCGVRLVTSDADTAGSGTEDICSIGGGKKSSPQTDLSNTQRQLERQCAAANLNLAASAAIRDVSCEGAFPGIENLVARCCNDADSVCVAGGDNADFTVDECISMIDFFNNEDFGDADADPIVDGPADPRECQASKKSGFVNGDGVRPGDRS